MERILIFIKHHFGFLWKVIEMGNSLVFSVLYGGKMEKCHRMVLSEQSGSSLIFRKLKPPDSETLYDLINSQEASDLEYFKPHKFDLTSLRRQFNNSSFLMMGAFDHEKLVGYFFLRFFANRKCFVGRLIDKEYRGKGIGLIMNNIMYGISWKMNFRCLSTISKNNTAVMKAHSRNSVMHVIRELDNNYLLVEFIKN